MSDQADKPEQGMIEDPPNGEDRPQEPTSPSPDSGLGDRAARLEAISRMIRAGQYHVSAAVIAERMLERLADRERRRVG